MTWKLSGQEDKLQTPCFEWYGLFNGLCVVVCYVGDSMTGADPGFQKGGGGGWQTIFIEGW